MEFKSHDAKKALSVEEAAEKCARPVLEGKFDGWRLLVEVRSGGVDLFSRTNHRYNGRHPEIEAELAKLPPDTILDGEIVSLADQDCTAVTNVFGKSVAITTLPQRKRLTYVIFDILMVAGVDARGNSLEERRHVLGQALERCGLDPEWVILAPQFPATKAEHDRIVGEGYEGVMVKDLDTKYASGKRGHGWFKLKSTIEIDVVVTEIIMDGKGQHEGKAGRWVASQYQDGELVERAKVNPYDDAMRNGMTSKPDEFIGRVATIKHYGLVQATGSDRINFRHPTFVRWREDKPAEACGYDNG